MNAIRSMMRSYLAVQMKKNEILTITKKIIYLKNNLLSFGVQYTCNIIPFTYYRTKPDVKEISGDSYFDEDKAKLVLKLNLKSPVDALPFYNLSSSTLLNIYKCTINDVESGFCKNRLYYIANKLQCPPSVLSRLITKRTFLYTLTFEWLDKSLNVLLEMGVPEERILRDLWVIKYHHATIRKRLQRVKDKGVDNLYPWMVRCSEDILNRSIQISQDAKNILGETTTTQMYLAKRLNISPEAIEEKYLKLPALKVIRVTKLKSFLDFLINEGFEVEEIADKIRVLTYSQKTIKQRLDKLRNIGMKHINLNIVCRSRKEFKKYCEALESARHVAAPAPAPLCTSDHRG